MAYNTEWMQKIPGLSRPGSPGLDLPLGSAASPRARSTFIPSVQAEVGTGMSNFRGSRGSFEEELLAQQQQSIQSPRRRHVVAGLLASHADATISDEQTVEDRIRMPVKLVGKNSPVDMSGDVLAHCMNPVAPQDTARASAPRANRYDGQIVPRCMKLRRRAVVQTHLAQRIIPAESYSPPLLAFVKRRLSHEELEGEAHQQADGASTCRRSMKRDASMRTSANFKVQLDRALGKCGSAVMSLEKLVALDEFQTWCKQTIQTHSCSQRTELIGEVSPRRRRHAVAELLAHHADDVTSYHDAVEEKIRAPVKLVGKRSLVVTEGVPRQCTNPLAHQDAEPRMKLRRGAIDITMAIFKDQLDRALVKSPGQHSFNSGAAALEELAPSVRAVFERSLSALSAAGA